MKWRNNILFFICAVISPLLWQPVAAGAPASKETLQASDFLGFQLGSSVEDTRRVITDVLHENIARRLSISENGWWDQVEANAEGVISRDGNDRFPAAERTRLYFTRGRLERVRLRFIMPPDTETWKFYDSIVEKLKKKYGQVVQLRLTEDAPYIFRDHEVLITANKESFGYEDVLIEITATYDPQKSEADKKKLAEIVEGDF